jgi:sugar lactone lactonase YvrE
MAEDGMAEVVVKSNDRLGECPLWDPRSRLVWWLDILRPAVQSYDPQTHQHRVYPLPARDCACAALRARGGLVLAMNNGLHAFDPAAGLGERLCQPEPDRPDNRYNDGRCDRRGRLWIGSMHLSTEKPTGSFYSVTPDLAVRRHLEGLTVPNSVAFSPDDCTLYFADTPHHVIWAFDFDIEAGDISNRRVFVDLSARKAYPDGSCIDGEGFLWNAEYAGGRVVRYAPDGRVDRVIEVPVENPTCCCFGGERLDTLYITSAASSASPGSLLAMAVGVRGLPEAMFGG